jgi:hypothetical protein
MQNCFDVHEMPFIVASEPTPLAMVHFDPLKCSIKG